MFVTKFQLREHMRALLKNQPESARMYKSGQIAAQLYEMEEYRKAKTILFYASCKGEVDTLEMIRKTRSAQKMIGLPKVIDNVNFTPFRVDDITDLRVGSYGILEPQAEDSKKWRQDTIDLVIVPGIAFDRRNNRLGRGKGYYDRFLKSLPRDVPTIGLAFDFQIVNCLPACTPQDHPVSLVLTN
jgi:5-formyltetrahydrofolate cyclo-ligase